MQLPGEFRVLLDCCHELGLELVEGKLGLLLHVLPDALLIGCVPGEACDETPRLVERHLGEVVFRRADSLHEAVHENHRSGLRVVEVRVGLDGLGDRLRPLQGLGDALRRLCAADRIAPDRRLADLVALRLEPRGEVFVGVGRVREPDVELRLDVVRELVDRRADPRPPAFFLRHRRPGRPSCLPQGRRPPS